MEILLHLTYALTKYYFNFCKLKNIDFVAIETFKQATLKSYEIVPGKIQIKLKS